MLKTEDFAFDLPEELIAQTPLKDRTSSKMMVVNREDESIESKHFSDILSYLKEGDALVINETRVLPARLYGTRVDTGGHQEILLLNNIEGDRWECLVKPARRAKEGIRLSFGEGELEAVVVEEREEGARVLEFEYDGIFLEILEKLGEMPLPPYIKEKLDDPERYQTVYAKEEGSAAAPTAGLHFTNELLDKVREKGVEIIPLVLHVGLGTFRPVSEEDISDHVMHSEYYSLSKEASDKINQVKENDGDIFAVGTTSVRTLETIARDNKGLIKAQSGWTDIFITPGFEFKAVDHLITNFHLPKSTLLMLVSAFSNRELMLKAYNQAVSEKYRFFSFGDAMLIL